MGVLRGAEQGFITETYTFVDRKLALKIAKHYNQIKHKHPPKDELLSEENVYHQNQLVGRDQLQC